ncbi:MAG: hypothetical protein LAT84_12445 [Balneolia bacterium]|nr:hypothetical protein [Balneolia bacterium]
MNTNNQNNRPIEDFEGLSAAQMDALEFDLFGEGCPVKLRKVSSEVYGQVPLLRQVHYIADRIAQSGEIRLSEKGFLPVKLVADIYSQGFLKDELIEKGTSKLYKETDSMSIHLTHILMGLAGIVKKRNGKLSLTKKGEGLLKDDNQLLRLLFDTFAQKFNWAYFDGYGESPVGAFGVGYTLFLLHKYGAEVRPESFYAEKYFMAFPELIEMVEPSFYRSHDEMAYSCYNLRTFPRFLYYFGLISTDIIRSFTEESKVSKTELLDKLFAFS